MKNKILISLIMFGLVLSGILGAKLIQAQTTELPVFQKVYQGKFDITQPGDVILPYTDVITAHWKRISIPEIRLDNMPAISVYLKPYGDEANFRPVDSWSLNAAPGRSQAISVKEGELYIWYKNYVKEIPESMGGQVIPAKTYYFCTGEYKIVITYTKGTSVTVTPTEEGTPIKKVVKLSEGDLVKAPDNKVYRVENNKLRHITSPEVMTQRGYKWSDVKNISADTIAQYEKGEPITPTTPVIQKPVEEKIETIPVTKKEWNLVWNPQKFGISQAMVEYKGKLYVGTTSDTDMGYIYVYDGQNWKESFSLNRMTFVDAEVYNNKLYFAGIYGPLVKYEERIYVYDGKEWKLDFSYSQGELGSSITGLATYRNTLYAFGDPRGILYKVYDRGWSIMEDSPALGAKNGVVLDGKLYIGNGRDVHIFDGNSWQKVTMPLEIMEHSGIVDTEVYNGKIYLLMSETGAGGVVIYDPDASAGADQWSWFKLPVYSNMQLSHVLKAYDKGLFIGVGTAGKPAKIYFYQNGSLTTSFESKDDNHFYSLAVFRNKLYAGSGFQRRIYVYGGAPSPTATTAVKLIRMKNTAGVYAVDENTGIKKPITDSSVFKSYGYNWEDVKIVEKREFDSYQTGEPVKLKDQTLVKVPGEATVYVVENEELRPIASPSVMEKYGYQWNKVQEVPKSVINLHQIGEVKE